MEIYVSSGSTKDGYKPQDQTDQTDQVDDATLEFDDFTDVIDDLEEAGVGVPDMTDARGVTRRFGTTEREPIVETSPVPCFNDFLVAFATPPGESVIEWLPLHQVSQ